MNRNIKAIGNAIMNIFWLVFLLYSFFLVHEAAHVAVARNMGCGASINPIPFSDTNNKINAIISTNQDCSGLTEKEKFEVMKAQSNVEAVGYQLAPFFVLFSILFLRYIQQKEEREKWI